MSDASGSPDRRPRARLAAVVGGLVAIGLVVLVAVALFAGGGPAGGDPAGSGSETTSGGGSSPQAGGDVAGGDAGSGGAFGDQREIVGDPVPAREFTMFDGSAATLADWEGQPLVVNFWASWCPPCVAEMRDAFRSAHQRHGDEVAFLGVNVQDSREQALDVVRRTGVTYPLAEDPKGQLFTEFGGFGMPMTVFVSPQGEVVGTHGGPLTRDQLHAKITDLLLAGG